MNFKKIKKKLKKLGINSFILGCYISEKEDILEKYYFTHWKNKKYYENYLSEKKKHKENGTLSIAEKLDGDGRIYTEILTYTFNPYVLEKKYGNTEGRYYFKIKDILEDNFGEVEVVKHSSFIDGEKCYGIIHFKDHNVYIKLDGYFSSYDDADWCKDIVEVFLKEKVVYHFERNTHGYKDYQDALNSEGLSMDEIKSMKIGDKVLLLDHTKYYRAEFDMNGYELEDKLIECKIEEEKDERYKNEHLRLIGRGNTYFYNFDKKNNKEYKLLRYKDGD